MEIELNPGGRVRHQHANASIRDGDFEGDWSLHLMTASRHCKDWISRSCLFSAKWQHVVVEEIIW